jgi:hypothetical protein
VKLLLDENIPHKLRAHLGSHETMTVAYMGWGSLKNGELLKAAEDAGFEVFVTGDRSLEYEQNMRMGVSDGSSRVARGLRRWRTIW